MMKKIFNIWLIVLAVILSLTGIVALVDRHRNIEYEGSWEGKSIVWMHESFFVDIPCETGLDLREEGLKPFFAWLYADSVNPLLRTLKNPVMYYTDWIVTADSGQPMTVQVIEKNASSPQAVVVQIEDATVFKTIDGIEIAYNEPQGAESVFMLQLQNGDRIIQFQFAYTLLDEVMPALEKAWNEMKK